MTLADALLDVCGSFAFNIERAVAVAHKQSLERITSPVDPRSLVLPARSAKRACRAAACAAVQDAWV